MSSRPRRPGGLLAMRRLARRLAAAPGGHPHGLVMTARTEVEAADGALRDALLDLTSPRFEEATDDASAAHEAARDRVHAVVGVYARALRRDGVGLLAVLAAVRATLLQDGGRLRSAAFAALHHDAMQCCREAFYAH